MSEAVVPIRAGVEPELDVEREMLDFVAGKLRQYREEYGEPPASIALALLGQDRGDAHSVAVSWTPVDENRSRLQCCSVGAALLMKRALGL